MMRRGFIFGQKFDLVTYKVAYNTLGLIVSAKVKTYQNKEIVYTLVMSCLYKILFFIYWKQLNLDLD